MAVGSTTSGGVRSVVWCRQRSKCLPKSVIELIWLTPELFVVSARLCD
jgi:hypothetical protein